MYKQWFTYSFICQGPRPGDSKGIFSILSYSVFESIKLTAHFAMPFIFAAADF